MAFMMKKKKYKFSVELCLEEITAVPFLSGVLFAKVRLLDGKSFIDTSSREEVQDHKVRWGAKFEFVCKMSANASTGILDPCMLRISVRKEIKGGRSFQKLGFTDLNLAEFAGSGCIQRKCLLEGYDTRRRQDNSTLSVTIKMNMISGDILFKVPSPTKMRQEKIPTGETNQRDENSDRRDDFSGGSIASVSSGFSSLTKKRPPLFNSDVAGEAEDNGGLVECYPGGAAPLDEGLEMGHSRNPSNTSQMSKGSGYGSMNSQHSRQSSSGDSGHIRCPSWPVWSPRLGPIPPTPPLSASPVPSKLWASPLLLKRKVEGSLLATPKSVTAFRFPPWSAPRATSSPGLLTQPSPSTPRRPLSPLAKNPPVELHERGLRKVSESCKLGFVSGEDTFEGIDDIPQTMTRVVQINNGSSCLVETGSLDRGKAALERRKKAAEEGPGSGRVEFTRFNTNSLIDQLLKATNLENTDETTKTTGLQLFIAKDGTTALGSQEVKSQMSAGVFKQVVIEENSQSQWINIEPSCNGQVVA
ncbi:protein FAM102A isoform X1 [Cimex lectularius]|uniref:C2 NT-type domain-containing protein n=1 Tax=Cimex lectularius TaxID=79782 RepID=A0A8I6SRG3_CIMLE|nr:protein FAM102A isoform X1 [Cimex lectularius]